MLRRSRMRDRDYDPNNSNDDSNDDSNYDITYNNLSDYQPKSERGQRLDIRNTLKVVNDESKTLEEILTSPSCLYSAVFLIVVTGLVCTI